MEKLNLQFKDELGTNLNKYGITESGGIEKEVTLRRLAKITQKGTPLNALSLNALVNKINEIIPETDKNTLNRHNHDNKNVLDQIKNLGGANGIATLDASGKVVEIANKSVDSDNLGGKPASDYSLKSELTESMKVVRDCKDEIEITNETGCSKDLALPTKESVYELLMINGDTRRASPNWFDIDIGSTIGSVKNGIVTTNEILAGSVVSKTMMLTGKITMVVQYEGFGKPNSATDFYIRFKDGTLKSNYSCRVNDGTYIINHNLDEYNKNQSFEIILYINSSIKISGKIKIMVLQGEYTLDNLPPFQKYDDHLVNSHCKLISTGENIWDEEWERGSINNQGQNEATSGYIRSKNYTPILPSSIYFYRAKSACNFYYYDKNKNYLKVEYSNQNTTFRTPSNAYYVRFWFSGSTYKNDIAIFYGSTPQPYVPHTEDIIADIGELAWNDSIDNVNNKKYVGTSKIINAKDLSFSLSPVSNPSVERYSAILPQQAKIGGIAPTKDNGLLINQFSTGLDEPHYYVNGADNNKIYIFIPRNIMPKQYFTEHPFYFSYELETITEIDMSSNPLPYTQKITKGGMQLQESINGGLPYNLTKLYAINIQAQVDANASANTRQNDEISALENRAKALENGKVDKEEGKDLLFNTRQDSIDLNNLKQTGFYYCAVNITHTPTYPSESNYWKVIVNGANSDCVQIASQVGNNKTFIRSFGGVTWTDWKEISNDSVITELAKKQNSTDNSLATTDKTVVGAINELNTNKANTTDIPTKTSELTNDSNFLTEHQDISGKQDSTDNTLETTAKTVAGAINELNTNKLNATDTAADSDKLGGVEASKYAQKTDLGFRVYRHTVKGNDENGDPYIATILSIDGNKITSPNWYGVAFSDFGKSILSIWWEVKKNFNAYKGNVLLDNFDECVVGVNYVVADTLYSTLYEDTTITEDTVE